MASYNKDMLYSERTHKELKDRAKKVEATSKDPIEILRAKCLARGAAGIQGIARLFKIMDDSKNGVIEYEEFKKGITEYGFVYTSLEMKELFNTFDKNSNGSIDYDEFLEKLRPPLKKNRITLINQAFDKLDKDHSGQVTASDLKGVYDVSKNPNFKNGAMTEEQILRKFLNTFDTKGHEDGIITREEFINYYASVSASIDNDAYFDLMMRNNWKLK